MLTVHNTATVVCHFVFFLIPIIFEMLTFSYVHNDAYYSTCMLSLVFIYSLGENTKQENNK